MIKKTVIVVTAILMLASNAEAATLLQLATKYRVLCRSGGARTDINCDLALKYERRLGRAGFHSTRPWHWESYQ